MTDYLQTRMNANDFIGTMRDFLLNVGETGGSPKVEELARTYDDAVLSKVVDFVCHTAEALHYGSEKDSGTRKIRDRLLRPTSHEKNMDNLMLALRQSHVKDMRSWDGSDEARLALTLKLVLETSAVNGCLEHFFDYAAKYHPDEFVALGAKILHVQEAATQEGGFSELDLRIAGKMEEIIPKRSPELLTRIEPCKGAFDACLKELQTRKGRDGDVQKIVGKGVQVKGSEPKKTTVGG